MTPNQLILLAIALVPFCVASVRAESTDCTTPVLIVSDGRVTPSIFSQNATYWYGIYAQAGHSYSVEFEPAVDNYVASGRVYFTTVNVYGPNDALAACRGNSSVAVTQNSGYAPVIQKAGNGVGRRVSFTAQGAGLHLISVTNLAGTGSYTFRAVDTTLFNPRWSTWSGYSDQWGFFNVSDIPLTGTLSLYSANYGLLTSVQFTIPPGGEVVRYASASDLNLPANRNGYATFSHNGPPGAVVADAYMTSPTGQVVTYVKFEGVSGH